MSPKKRPVLSVEEKEQIAAQLLAASEGLLSTAQAMKTCGMTSPQRSESRKKRVYRKAKKIKCVGLDDLTTTIAASASASTPRQLVMEPVPTSQEQHSVSSLSAPPSNSPSTSTNQGPAEQNELRRQLQADLTIGSDNHTPKKRRSSAQVHMDLAEKNKKRKKQSAAVKLMTQ